MVDHVILDAMIQRADFAIDDGDNTAQDQITTLSVESLGANSMVTPLLRKPDFQRETNQWSPDQVVTFLESYSRGELIPSVILWKSPSFLFVIDGGHRLSALRAWIEDDYGDGTVSTKFYANEISAEQKKLAEKTRTLVNSRVGNYKSLRDALLHQDKYPADVVQRARNVATKQLQLQWVVGDAKKAETSFFKINTQGTPLDPIEERLLLNRKRPIAIAARSIVRAGTGHKYWSDFPDERVKEIEHIAAKLHALLFKPELSDPIKTLNLPLAGRSSPIGALDLLMRLISITHSSQSIRRPAMEDFPEDADGSGTVSALKRAYNILRRVTGNDESSLGLHPAVYFYTERGRHSVDLFLGMAQLFANRIANNDDKFFQNFTEARSKLEKFLIGNKPLIGALLQSVGSRQRVDKIESMFASMVSEINAGKEITEKFAIEAVGPSNMAKILTVTEPAPGSTFSRETKSAIYLRDSVANALKCPICHGLLEPSQAASFDHIERRSEGGNGATSNGQITHPYCNTGYKN